VGSFQLQELNHRHMAICDYLLKYPSARLREVAEAVGMTSAWVSTVTNSELFRNYMMERHREIGGSISASLHEKVHGVAHASVEKLGKMVDESTDPDFILSVADRAMHRLGMGPEKKAAVQLNTFNAPVQQNTTLDPQVLADARAKILELAGANDASSMSSPARIQTDHRVIEGEVSTLPAPVHSEKEAEG
jgi:hypothetical protein